MEWEWSLVDPLVDIEEIILLCDENYGPESEGFLTRDRGLYRKNLTVAAAYQKFDRSREFLAVAKTVPGYKRVVHDGFVDLITAKPEIVGFCWFDRGGFTTYAPEEISNAKFHHVRLDLSPRLRVRLINEMIDQHILWAGDWGIPVICSTSIRGEHGAFMRIHERRGFKVHGSYAWIRTKDGLEWMKSQQK